jgi:hypothetical protein
MRSEWRFSPDAQFRSHASVNAAAAADRRFGMAKRIEQSRRHGHYDPRWSGPVLAVNESPLPVDEPEEPSRTPPTLTLVGGTDVTPTPLDPLAPART